MVYSPTWSTYAFDAADGFLGILRKVLGQQKAARRTLWIRIEANNRRFLLAEGKQGTGTIGGQQKGAIAANGHNNIRPAHDILAQRASKFKSACLIKSTATGTHYVDGGNKYNL